MTKKMKEEVTIEELGPSKELQEAFDALKLNRHRLFFKEYWLDGCRNMAHAAVKAGFSEKGASIRGSLILRSKEGRRIMKAWLNEIGSTPETILAEFHRINNASLYDFRGLFEGKSLEDLHEAGIDLRQIRKLKVTRRTVGSGENAYQVEDIYVELYDRLKALVTQAKILKMFTDVGDAGLGAEAIIAAMEKSKAEIETDPDDVSEAIKNNGGAAHGSKRS